MSISMEEMKDGALYHISARNSRVGIWRAASSSFEIPRVKFGHAFLFEEDHYDTGAPFGTARALNMLAESVPDMDDKQKLKYLQEKEAEIWALSQS